MSLFVEVESLEKQCKVIINLEHIVEVAPLVDGGCALFFNDSAAVGGVRTMKVKDSYNQFKQFAMQPVSSEMIADRIAKITPVSETPAKPARVTKTAKVAEFDIPKL